MNTNALATLAAILDTGSFAAAAARVGCTPSAVSLQVKQLETYFGQPLFDRSARVAKPTAFAHEAGALARDWIARMERLRARPSTTVTGRVRLGAIATIQTDALPQALRLLRDRHPALEIRMLLDDSDSLQAHLRAGHIDAAALVRPRTGGSSRFVWQDLTRQAFVMLVPADAGGGPPQDLLRRMHWIRYDTALTGGRIAAQFVKRICPDVRCAMEVRSIDAIVAMVSAGLGASVVPRPRRALLDAHAVREVRLGRSGPTRQVALVRRSADIDNRNIDALHQALVAVYTARSSEAS